MAHLWLDYIFMSFIEGHMVNAFNRIKANERKTFLPFFVPVKRGEWKAKVRYPSETMIRCE